MALNSQSFTMIFCFLALFGVSTAVGGRKALAVESKAQAPNGDFDFGFLPLYPKDSKIVELAKFVVDEYNKEYKKNVNFTTVLEAISYTKVPFGTKYGLVVLASDNDGPNAFDADVMVDQNSKRVISFKKIP